MLFMIPTIAGSLGFLLAPQDASAGRLICYYLTGSYQASFVLGLSLITSNTGGQTKKQLTSASVWLGACVGNIAGKFLSPTLDELLSYVDFVGPFFYRQQDAPSYKFGIGSMLVCNCLEVLVFLALRLVLMRQNRIRDNKKKEVLPDGVSEAVPNANETAFSDMTDQENVKYVNSPLRSY